MNLIRRSRYSIARVAVGVAVAFGIVVAAPAVSGAVRPMAASTPVTVFGGGGASVTIPGHGAWVLSVDYTSGTTSQLGIVIQRAVSAGGKGFEIHTWTLPSTKTSGLKHTGSTWTLNVTNTLAIVNLTFHQTGSSKGSCSTGSETIYTGTISGSVKFNTELSTAKTVTATNWTVAGSKPLITVSSLCVAKYDPCVPLESFVSGHTPPVGAGSIGTLEGLALHAMTVAARASVSQLKGTVREDVALLDQGTLTINVAKKTGSVATSATGIVSGSASLTHGTVTNRNSTCTYAGKKYKQVSSLDIGATYASSAHQQLVGHVTLTPTITVTAKSTSAIWQDQTETPI